MIVKHHDNHAQTYFLVSFIFLMLFFYFGAAIMERYKPRVGHETGATIALGMLISYLFWIKYGNDMREGFKFS